MNIFISNDDGINADGIKALTSLLSQNHNVLVVAPDGNRSAYSHSLSIRKKLKLNKISNYCNNTPVYSLSGTPVDCVKFANIFFKDFNADVVVGGINNVHNLGTDTFYSATFSIACEGAFFNKINFAFSLFNECEGCYEKFAVWAKKIIEKLTPLSSAGDIYNVNFPKDPDNVKGVKFTKLGKQIYSDRYDKVGENEYLFDGELLNHDFNDQDTDVEQVRNGYISITPILFDKTNFTKLMDLRNKCIEL